MRISRSKGAWRAVPVASLMSMVLPSVAALAQQQTRVAVTGGIASDQRGVSSRALAVAPTVYFNSSTGTLFSLGGNFTRFNNQAVSAGIGTALAVRNRLAGPFTFAFDASGDAARLSAEGASASFFTLTASPIVDVALGSMTVFGGARAGIGRIAQDTARRLVPPSGGGATPVSETRSGIGPSAGFTFTQSPNEGEVVRLAGRGDAMMISGVRITDWTLSLAMVNSVGIFNATLGTREAPDEHGPFGGASLSMEISPSINLIAAAGHYAPDRLTGARGGGYGSIGFAFGSPRRIDARAPGPPVRGVAAIRPIPSSPADEPTGRDPERAAVAVAPRSVRDTP
jgi:hypothetical protein